MVRELPDGQLSVDMGAVQTGGTGWAVIGGRKYAGLAVRVGNPHLACLVTEPLAGLDLSQPPEVDAAQFPDGVNVELVRLAGERRIEMRVHERGSGATMSCGTGAVAAAVAAAAGEAALPPAGTPAGTPPWQWTVDVPGGRLLVTPSLAASVLTGPAVIVAEGAVRPDWLAAAR
jgi:diaminopimelate epimerase